MAFFSLKRSGLLALLVLGAFSLSGCGSAPAPVTFNLEVWGVLDDTDAYSTILTDYRKVNPNIKGITYRKLPIETYKTDLINALAAGKGPDIFMIRNAWRGAFEDKTAPAPATLISEQEYRNRLVDVAAADFISTDKKIYGVPLSVDSLALYYNKDLFNVAGITEPPKTWDEVAADARILNAIDQFGAITRSGIALGIGANINRSPDILAALMMQLGSDIKDRVSGKGSISLSDENSQKALEFYTKFSRVGSDVYSWNARQDYSLDAFYKGNLAMMVNYSWQYDTIKQKNAKLNIGVAPLPQFDAVAPANMANYWGYVVAKDKPVPPKNPNQPGTSVTSEQQNQVRTFEAWQFLKYLTLVGKDKKMNVMNALSGTSQETPLTSDPTKVYLTTTHKPAARRDLVAEQKGDLVLAPFAYGNLIAKNWYQGDSEGVDGVLIDTIDSAVRGEKTVKTALEAASSRINLLAR